MGYQINKWSLLAAVHRWEDSLTDKTKEMDIQNSGGEALDYYNLLIPDIDHDVVVILCSINQNMIYYLINKSDEKVHALQKAERT